MTSDPSATQRHNLAKIDHKIPLRRYQPLLAPVQLQLFKVWTDTPDPEACVDGNVVAIDQARFSTENSNKGKTKKPEFEIVSNDFLQVSGVRNV